MLGNKILKSTCSMIKGIKAMIMKRKGQGFTKSILKEIILVNIRFFYKSINKWH